MKVNKIIGGLVLLTLLLGLKAYGADNGLYFKAPSIDGLNDQQNVEVGANGSFQMHYKRTAGFASADRCTGFMAYFNYDSAKINTISFALNGAFAGQLSATVNQTSGNEYQIQVMATSPSAFITVTDDIVLGTVNFHVKQDLDMGGQAHQPWNISWSSNPNYVNISLFNGATSLGLDTAKTDPAPGWNVEMMHVPNFVGSNPAANNPMPPPGNTLNLAWTTSVANDLTDQAATYYGDGTPGGGGLKYKIYWNDEPANAATYKRTTATGAASNQVTGLNDKQTYTFKVTAIDACTDTANESTNNNGFNGIPHDYVPPGAHISVVGTDDRQINLSWSCDDAADLEKFIIARKETTVGAPIDAAPTPNNAGVVGADENADGDTPDSVITALHGAGYVIVYNGSAANPNFPDRGGQEGSPALDNSKQYTYWCFTTDKIGGSPLNQGHNWSRLSTFGIPGAKPDAISNFSALSDIPNGITFRWLTSTPPTYAGTKIVYTTDYTKWKAIDQNTPEVAVDYPISDAAATSPITQESAWTTGLTASTTYYFKAYARNSSSMLWSDPMYTAAVPGGLGGGETSIPLAFTAGPNVIGIPQFSKGLTVNNIPVTTIQELAAALNTIASAKVVTAIAFLDNSTKQVQGATYTDGAVAIKNFDVDATPIKLEAGRGYQVSVSAPVNFTIKAQ